MLYSNIGSRHFFSFECLVKGLIQFLLAFIQLVGKLLFFAWWCRRRRRCWCCFGRRWWLGGVLSPSGLTCDHYEILHQSLYRRGILQVIWFYRNIASKFRCQYLFTGSSTRRRRRSLLFLFFLYHHHLGWSVVCGVWCVVCNCSLYNMAQ
jgi:hypothetical protein